MNVSRLRRIPPAELADVARAQGALVAALVRTRLRPRGQLVAPATDTAPEVAPPELRTPAQLLRIARLARAVDRAARRGLFRPTCLVRSLALTRLLEGAGITGARIRIGVRPADSGRSAAGGVHAHAWVEVDGRVIGDDPRHVSGFAPVGSVTGLPAAGWR